MKPLVKGEDTFCTYCISDLPRSNDHHEAQTTLKQKFAGRLPVTFACAFLKFRKRGNVQRILHAFKYRNRPQIGYKLGLVYGSELAQAGIANQVDFIIPVPLHPSRLRQRGYNQSEEWAKGLSVSLGVPVVPGILLRAVRTRTQTRRSRLGRWENVREVFFVQDEATVYQKGILLVDDVVTTGATLESCGNVLLKAGCKSLSISCIAATQ